MTVKQIISEVRNDLRSVNLDVFIPGAYIHSKLIAKAQSFIKRDADSRMFTYNELWNDLDCITMKEKPLATCCDIVVSTCDTVLISEDKLPQTYSSKTGPFLQIFSLDYSKAYTLTDPQGFRRAQNREYVDRSKRYAWLSNGYLVIPVLPNMLVSKVKARGMFEKKHEALNFGCNKPSNCHSLLDEEFIAPGYLLDDIKKATVIDIAQVRERIVEDTFPNGNSNEKTNPSI